MRICTRSAWFAMAVFFGVSVYGQDLSGIKLNPGEKIIAINGVPVEKLGINPDGTRMGTIPANSGAVVVASAPSSSGAVVTASAPSSSGAVVTASATSSTVGSVSPAVATNIVGNLVSNGLPFSHSPGETVMDKVNYERRLNGMGPLTPDPELMELALRKATIAAQRRYKNHIGGSLGSARAEGVGHTQGRFLSCCLDMPATYGGAAMVQGADGWYCCLLVR
jgi:hypothetical protein